MITELIRIKTIWNLRKGDAQDARLWQRDSKLAAGALKVLKCLSALWEERVTRVWGRTWGRYLSL